MVKLLPINIDLPRHFLDDEERSGYLVTSKMKKVWAVELDLLNEFQQVCKKYNLQYYAVGGTLLGAVRHNGFIPWDDDIDVAMFREDYDKLVSIASDVFHSPYCFQTTRMDMDLFRHHAHLRNEKTTGILKSQLGVNYRYNQGIFIDIFVLDGVPSNVITRWLQCKKLCLYYKTLNNKACPILRTVKGNMIHRLLETMEGMGLDFQNVYNHYDNISRKSSRKNTEYVSWVMKTGCFSAKYIFRSEDFDKTIEMPFEFLNIIAPQNYNTILTTQYGDYMKHLHEPTAHGDVIFDPENPCGKYLHY